MYNIPVNCALTLHRCPVQISTRTGAWVFNNYTFGPPGDLGFNRMTVRPSNSKKNLLGALFLKSLVTMLQGHPTRYVLRQIENNWFLFFYRCQLELSTRCGAWVFPNYWFGNPAELHLNRVAALSPMEAIQIMYKLAINIHLGHPNR